MILPALNSSAGWETQIAALKTLSTLAETDELCETLNDEALEKIFTGLSDGDSDVRAQVLKTLAVLAKKQRFHNKIKNAIQDTLPLLEDWAGTLEGWNFTVRRQALDTFAVFANYGIFVASDPEISSQLISMLTEGDTDTITRLLVILQDAGLFVQPSQVRRSLSASSTATRLEISAVTNSLGHPDWRIRVAGLRVLESLATDTKYDKVNFPAEDTIVQCLSDPVEEVQVAGLRTLLKFIDKDIFGGRSNVPKTVPDVISSLLRSESEDVRASALEVISDYIIQVEFYSTIEGLIPAIVQLLDRTDEDSHVAMLQTIYRLADTGQFFTHGAFVGAIRRIFPALLSDRSAAVRMAALQILPVISKHDVFGGIVADALEPLLKAVMRKDDGIGNAEEADDTFRIDVLRTLSDLAQNEIFSDKIQTRLSKSYALAAKGTWPARVAFLKLMSVLGTSAKDPLKRMVKQMIPDIRDALHDKENDEVRMAGVQLLSISVVEDISTKDSNSLLATLMTLLFDREEYVRSTARQTLSDLAKQDTFREAINEASPAILEALDQIETDTRLAALETCGALAQDVAFREIINRAAPQIIACLTDADDDVQIAAMMALSQLCREEAFWLVVSEAAPHVMSQLESNFWHIRRQVLRTLSIFAENDAFGDIMTGLLPKILEHIKDHDDDVRVEVLKMLLNLVQQNFYQASILGALKASGLTPLVDLTKDDFRRVRMAVIPLISKVVEVSEDVFHGTAGMVIAAMVELLLHDDEECVVALEALRTLVEQDVAYAKELSSKTSELIAALKPDDIKSGIPAAVLWTLAALVTQYRESVDQVVDAVSTLFSVIKDTEEPQFWDATAKVFVALVSLGSDPNDNVHKFVSSCVNAALDDSNRHARMLGLLVMESIQQGIAGFEVKDCKQSVLEWVDSPDLDVRLSAISVAASLDALDAPDRAKLHAATQKTWRELTDIANPSLVELEKLSKIADHADVFINEQSTDIISPLTAALKDESEEIALSCLGAIFKLASEYKFRATLVQVVPRITALLSNRKSDTQFRVGVLECLLKLANHPQFCVKIQGQASAIIPVLRDRDSKVRAAGLQVLSKLVQGGYFLHFEIDFNGSCRSW
ncbi:armadillo-type protein [Mycena sanguinolenta]|nr:armadillo-type protein [Mycena sanguinolenta]